MTGDAWLPGPRPDAKGIDRGPWEPFTVYMAGDTVTDADGRKWRARVDYRSGALPPAEVMADLPAGPWCREGGVVEP